jgi:general secretion pathway protein G
MRSGERAFTLIELLVVLTILALLLSLALPKYFNGVERAKEVALKETLNTVRDGIDKFHADQGVYPESLEQLVDKRYLNKVPYDPVTESVESWQIVPPPSPNQGNVYDVHSGALGNANDGTEYATW